MSALNHPYRHWFVHVPKTAGTAMERMPFVGGQAHRTARQLAPRAPADYFGWGFVRNPYDRLVACFHAAQQHAPGRYFPASMGFAEWIRGLPGTGAGFIHPRPMVDFLCWPDGSLAVDFVGRYEHLAGDWRIVCRRIGVEHQPLRHLNASAHRDWREYYTDDLAAHVAELYAADFDTFGYSKEISSPRRQDAKGNGRDHRITRMVQGLFPRCVGPWPLWNFRPVGPLSSPSCNPVQSLSLCVLAPWRDHPPKDSP